MCLEATKTLTVAHSDSYFPVSHIRVFPSDKNYITADFINDDNVMQSYLSIIMFNDICKVGII